MHYFQVLKYVLTSIVSGKNKIKLGKPHILIRFRIGKINNRFRIGDAHEKKYGIFAVNATHLSVPFQKKC